MAYAKGLKAGAGAGAGEIAVRDSSFSTVRNAPQWLTPKGGNAVFSGEGAALFISLLHSPVCRVIIKMYKNENFFRKLLWHLVKTGSETFQRRYLQ